MKKAIFITGFNNWGKTTIINHRTLFGRSVYYLRKVYRINNGMVNTEFIVENHSNDDYIGETWIERIKYRIAERVAAEQDGREPIVNWDLFTALCPSMENENNFVELLNDAFFENYQKHVFLIKYKWEHHAELIIPNIQHSLAQGAVSNLTTYVIDQDQHLQNRNDIVIAQTNEIHRILQIIFP